MTTKKKEEKCCPKFDTKLYDNKTFTWKDKKFLYGEVFQIMHIPVNMGFVITKMFAKVEKAKAFGKKEEFLMLCHDPSPWKSQIYMSVSQDIPDSKMAYISGKFVTKVYDGPYQAVPLWLKDMDGRMVEKGVSVLKYYIHYAYCPKCAQKFGHNYGVVFAQTE